MDTTKNYAKAILIGGVVALLLGLLASVWYYRSQLGDAEDTIKKLNSELATERTLRAADQEAIATRDATLRKVAAKKGINEKALSTALSMVQDWSNTPIPDDVSQSLGM